MKTFNAIIGGIVNYILVIALTAIWKAWVLVQIWAWLIVPLFHLPELRVISAYAIILVVSFLTFRADPDVETKKRSLSEAMIRTTIIGVIAPAFVLLTGWIAHYFV